MNKRLVSMVIAIFMTLLFIPTAEAANSSSITKLILSKSSVFESSGKAFSTQPDVTVADSSNKAVKDSGNTITASITSGVGGSLVGTTTATTGSSGKEIGRAHV